MELKDDPNDADSLWRRAETFIKLGIMDRALDDANKAVEQDSENSDFWIVKVLALIGNNKFGEAYQAIEQGIGRVENDW